MLGRSDWQNAKLYEDGMTDELLPQWVHEVAAQRSCCTTRKASSRSICVDDPCTTTICTELLVKRRHTKNVFQEQLHADNEKKLACATGFSANISSMRLAEGMMGSSSTHGLHQCETVDPIEPRELKWLVVYLPL